MDKLNVLIKKYAEVKNNLVKTKLNLELTTQRLYNEWKTQNPKDRTAMDKVVAVLRETSDELIQAEQEYIEAQLEYNKIKAIYDVVVNMLSNPNFNKDDVKSILNNLEWKELLC